MRTARRPSTGSRASTRARLATLVAGAACAAGLAACSATSPAPIITPYPASDGVSSSISDPSDGSQVLLRNLLVVAPDDALTTAGRGRLVGSVVNTGTEPVDLQVSLAPSADAAAASPPTRVTVPASGIARIGEGSGPSVVLTGITGAGTFVRLQVASGSGSATVQVPVVSPAGPYATLTPPSPSPSAASPQPTITS